jgi:molybdate transport system substrate-binding protein
VHLLLAVLTIAAASNLQPVLARLGDAFQRETGQTVTITLSSSGSLFAQIQNGAPFDVFLSADMDYPRALDTAGLAEPSTLTTYATGSVVMWARRGSPVDLRGGLTALADSRVRRIAIANPAHAPYGRAAVAALERAGIYDRVRAKLVFGENVEQAAQFVESGNADAGLIPLVLAKSASLAALGDYAPIPPAIAPPLEQGAVVIRKSQNKDAARAFLAYLRRPDVEAILAQAGFGAVPAPAAR